MTSRGPLEASLAARSWVEVWDRELPALFEDVAAERAVIDAAVGLLDMSYRGLVDLRGDDVAAFLEKIVSCHVDDVSPTRGARAGQGRRACLLSAKGRLLGAFQLHRLDGTGFRAVFAEPARSSVVKTFARYGFLSDIEVAEASGARVLGVRGPQAGALLESLGAALPGSNGDDLARAAVRVDGLDVDLVRISRHGEHGFDLWVDGEHLVDAWASIASHLDGLGGRRVGWLAAERERIESGRARFGAEYEEESFPGEVGEEDALTYDKCYVGQEVVARTRTYGQVSRRLFRVSSDRRSGGEVPRTLLVGEKPAATLTSFDGEVGRGLAVVKRRHWEAAELRDAEGGEYTLLPDDPELA